MAKPRLNSLLKGVWDIEFHTCCQKHKLYLALGEQVKYFVKHKLLRRFHIIVNVLKDKDNRQIRICLKELSNLLIQLNRRHLAFLNFLETKGFNEFCLDFVLRIVKSRVYSDYFKLIFKSHLTSNIALNLQSQGIQGLLTACVQQKRSWLRVENSPFESVHDSLVLFRVEMLNARFCDSIERANYVLQNFMVQIPRNGSESIVVISVGLSFA